MAAAMTTLLDVRDLHVSFTTSGVEQPAVCDVSATVSARERVGIIGESGSGKSTLLAAVVGLLPGTATVSGQAVFDGRDLLRQPSRPILGRKIGFILQSAMNALNPVARIDHQVAEPMIAHCLCDRRSAHERAHELLNRVGIPAARMRVYPHELSGGMRQRAVIARALACEPILLLADEPTTALDVIVQRQILALMDELCEQLGLALVLVTHDLAVAANICSRLLVMKDGRVLEQGSTDQICRAPQTEYARRLVTCARAPMLEERELP
jgi:ABC-type glutathione transport system ATPase component